MLPRQLRLPASLSVTALALSGCSAPNPPSDASADGADDCTGACSAIHATVNTACMPQVGPDGANVCMAAPDSGMAGGFCSNARVAPASSAQCCCDVVV